MVTGENMSTEDTDMAGPPKMSSTYCGPFAGPTMIGVSLGPNNTVFLTSNCLVSAPRTRPSSHHLSSEYVDRAFWGCFGLEWDDI